MLVGFHPTIAAYRQFVAEGDLYIVFSID